MHWCEIHISIPYKIEELLNTFLEGWIRICIKKRIQIRIQIRKGKKIQILIIDSNSAIQQSNVFYFSDSIFLILFSKCTVSVACCLLLCLYIIKYWYYIPSGLIWKMTYIVQSDFQKIRYLSFDELFQSCYLKEFRRKVIAKHFISPLQLMVHFSLCCMGGIFAPPPGISSSKRPKNVKFGVVVYFVCIFIINCQNPISACNRPINDFLS